MGKNNSDDNTFEHLDRIEELTQEQRAEKVRIILQEVVDLMEKERIETEMREILTDVIEQSKIIYDLSIEAGFDKNHAFALAAEFFNGVVL